MSGENERLRFRIIGMAVVILTMGFFATNAMSYLNAVETLKSSVLHRELPLTGRNIYSEVQADLVRPIAISSQMANDTFLRDWLLDGERDPGQISRYLTAIRDKYNVFTSYLISDKTKEYYHFTGPARRVAASNPDDVWFFRVETSNAPYEINIDYDLASNRTVTIFVNYRVLDSNGAFLGVTGVGLNLSSVQNIVDRYRSDFQRNVYFIDKSGDLTLASQNLKDGAKNIRRLPGLDAIADRILSKDEGQYEYQRDGETYLLETQFVPELNWYIMVEQRQSAVTESLRSSFVRNLWISGAIIALTAAMIGFAISIYHSKLEALATRDKLTGLVNRQAFDDALEKLLASRKRNARPCALMLIDIDHFKTINDSYGHLKGDDVIRAIAARISDHLRPGDLACRWGGEEVIILFPDSSLEEATQRAEALRAAIGDMRLSLHDADVVVTVSVGVADFQTGDVADALLGRADRALYQAKADGRNCVRPQSKALEAKTATPAARSVG